MENALERWEDVKHKTYRESLRDNADLIRQSRELARIKCDLDIELDLDELKARPPDRSAAYELFKELEFANLTREFADAAQPITSSVETNYKRITKKSDLDLLLQSVWNSESIALAVADVTPAGTGEQQCSFDYETSGGIAIATAPGVAAYIDLEHFEGGFEAALPGLREVLGNGLLEKSVHDLKRAVGLLAQLNIKLEGVKDDVFLAAYLLDPNQANMNSLNSHAKHWVEKNIRRRPPPGPNCNGKLPWPPT
jgi:DNA polymerase-1